ncbi:MAG: hypothetical protein MZV70_29395 [Desulfobacterales bacterium]|nr:hypothetical protein [Desulfobacterales bacterium]
MWIATALVMGVFIGFYHRWVQRYSRVRVVLASCLAIAGILSAFRAFSANPGPVASTCLFVFHGHPGSGAGGAVLEPDQLDLHTPEGRGWYGVVGTGGLVGGMVGGWLAALLLKITALKDAGSAADGSRDHRAYLFADLVHEPFRHVLRGR